MKNIALALLLTFGVLTTSINDISAKRAPISNSEIKLSSVNVSTTEITKDTSTEAPEKNTKIKKDFTGETPVLDFFHGKECPHCQKEKKWHPILKAMFPNIQINEYEVWHDEKNQALLQTRLDALGKISNGVPTNIIGNEVITGFDAKGIIKAITKTYGIEPLEVDEAKMTAELKNAGKQKKLIILGVVALIFVAGGFFFLKKSA